MKAALLIGINDYKYLSSLTAPVPDALAVEELLGHHASGGANFDCKVILSAAELITEQLLRRNIQGLFEKDLEVALLYISGHEAQDKLGSYLCPQDMGENQRGLSLHDVLGSANLSKTRNVVIILDCCHAGGAAEDGAFMREGVSTLRDDVCILAASRGDRVAMEIGGKSVFTAILCEGLKGAAADFRGHVTAASLFAHIERSLGAWDQRPVLKANVSRLIPIRECEPTISYEKLRKLPEIFTGSESKLDLDPDYEPWDAAARVKHGGSAEGDKTKAARYQILMGLRDNGLVETPDSRSLYYAAMDRKSCRLTATGKYIWRLANDGRI